MEDKSNIEILRDFAKSTNRSIVVKEIPYPVSGVRKIQLFKRLIYIPNNPERTSFFVWLNDPYLKIGQTTIFSGAYIPLSSIIKSTINIRNRYILDKLDIFSRKRDNRIGNGQFDSKVVISGNLDAALKGLLTRSKIQKQIIKALEIESFLNISINEYKIDFVPELSNNPNFAIINRQGWEIAKDNIENMFDQVEKIREMIDYNERK